MKKPLIIIENYGKTSQVTVCGVKVGHVLSEVSYTAKNPKDKMPHIKVDINIINALHLIANLKTEEIKEISEIAQMYLTRYKDTVARADTIMQATKSED